MMQGVEIRLSEARSRFRRFLGVPAQSTLARNTLWAFGAQVGRVALQATYFVIIARTLNVDGYGTFVAANAIVFVLVPFASWGAGNVLVMHVARDPASAAIHWGKLIIITLTVGVVTILISFLSAIWLLPSVSGSLVVKLAVAELLFGRLTEGGAQVFQALQRMALCSSMSLLPFMFRLLAAVGLASAGSSSSPETWASWYLGSAVGAFAVAFALVTLIIGIPRFQARLLWEQKRLGAYFAMSQATATIYADIDKTLLARLSTLDQAGVYAAAYRIMAIAGTPLRSLLLAAYPRFFQRGEHGVKQSYKFAVALLPFSVSISVLASLLLFVFSPAVPILLGSGYEQSTSLIRWLCVLPVIQSIYYPAADALTGAGRQGLRTLLQLVTVLANITLILWFVPKHGALGAAWASIIAELFLLASVWTIVTGLSRQKRSAPE